MDHRHETKRDCKTVNEKQINHVADAIKGIKILKNKTPKMKGQISPAHYRDVACVKNANAQSQKVSVSSLLFYGEETDKQTNPKPKKKIIIIRLYQERDFYPSG